jgi:hypothetical protein
MTRSGWCGAALAAASQAGTCPASCSLQQQSAAGGVEQKARQLTDTAVYYRCGREKTRLSSLPHGDDAMSHDL